MGGNIFANKTIFIHFVHRKKAKDPTNTTVTERAAASAQSTAQFCLHFSKSQKTNPASSEVAALTNVTLEPIPARRAQTPPTSLSWPHLPPRLLLDPPGWAKGSRGFKGCTVGNASIRSDARYGATRNRRPIRSFLQSVTPPSNRTGS